MIRKKELIFAILATFSLTSMLFLVIPIRSPTTAGEYDPWIDTNDDGIIDYQDLYNLASMYRTSGTPINKTALLLKLEARINSLNTSLLTDYYNITECHVVFVDASGDIITGYLNVDSGTLYVDDVYNRVGVGTTSPTTKLDVAGDIQGETLKVDDIYLGSSEGNSYIYFYNNGVPFGEYIYWQDADDEFVVSDDIEISGNMRAWNIETTGDVQVWGAITVPTTERYYSIPGCAWQPAYSTYEFSSVSFTYTTTAGETWWLAPVNLPHGAVVTEFRAWVYDNDATDIDVYLYRRYEISSNELASVSSSGASASFVQYADDSIGYATVDNQNYAYHLWAVLRSGNSEHRLGQVRITYTITEPLP